MCAGDCFGVCVTLRDQPGAERRDCVQRPECGKLWLEDHLIAPIQRLPRYILLFRELRKRTPVDHADHANLMRVRKTLSCVDFGAVLFARSTCHSPQLLPELEQLATRLNESRRSAEKRFALCWCCDRLSSPCCDCD